MANLISPEIHNLRNSIISSADRSSEGVGIMFSGGIDSSLIAGIIKDYTDTPVYLFAFDDDSVNYKTRRIIAIEQIAQHYGLYDNLKIIRMHRNEELRQRDTFGLIPGYKLSMQIACMSYCQKYGIDRLYMGYNRENTEYYTYTFKDELTVNIKAAAELYALIYDYKVHIDIPFENVKKADIIRLGVAAKFPFEKTISCRETRFGGLTHCGHCLPCQSRWEGFELAGVKDPTEYYDKRPFDMSKLVVADKGAVLTQQVNYSAPKEGDWKMENGVSYVFRKTEDGSLKWLKAAPDEYLSTENGIVPSPKKISPKKAAAMRAKTLDDEDEDDDDDCTGVPKKLPVKRSVEDRAIALYEQFAGSAIGSRIFPRWSSMTYRTKRKWRKQAAEELEKGVE